MGDRYRILGIDPGLNITGYGILERDNGAIKVIEAGVIRPNNKQPFENRLLELGDNPLVGEVRGSHFMLCIENVANKETKETLPDEINIGKRISDACEKRGLIVRPVGHHNVLSPPLILSKEQIDFIVDTLHEAELVVADELKSEGVSLS